MDYLKFLGATVLAVVGIWIEFKFFGINIGFFLAIGVSIGVFAMSAPNRYTAGYIAWVVTIFIWTTIIQALLHLLTAQYPNKYSPVTIHTAAGFWLIVGMIVLHPVCYGVARLVYRKPIPVSENIRYEKPGSTKAEQVAALKLRLKQRRNAMLPFCAIVLIALTLGKVVEFAFHIPRLPFEYYVCLCSVLAGVAFVAWRKSLGAMRDGDASAQPMREDAVAPRRMVDQVNPQTGKSVWGRPDLPPSRDDSDSLPTK